MKCLLTGLIVLSAAALPARADAGAAPVGIPHQGRLLIDGEGPVNNSLEVTFSLYTQAAGGAPVWQETRPVTFRNGFYSLLLGDPAAVGVSTPIDPAIIRPPLFLGVRLGSQDELNPRQPVRTMPFAMAAGRAERMLGGTIEGAAITGGTIDATEIVVGDQVMIDGDGRYLGPTDSLNVSQLGGIAAADFVTRNQAVNRYIPKAEDSTVTSLRATGLQATVLQANTLNQPPLTVLSANKDNNLVEGLNVEKVGGLTSDKLLTREAFYGGSLENRVRNGTFDLPGQGGLPAFYEVVGTAGAGSVTLQADGPFGGKALEIADQSEAATLAVRQLVLGAGDVRALGGQTFTATVLAKRRAGVSVGEFCLVESEEVRTCEPLSGVETDFVPVTVRHTLTAQAAGLWVVLSPSRAASDLNTYRFDGLTVTRGTVAPGWRPAPAERITAAESLYGVQLAPVSLTGAKFAAATLTGDAVKVASVAGSRLADTSIPAAKLVQGPGSELDADLVDGLDSAAFLRTDRTSQTDSGVSLRSARMGIGAGAVEAAALHVRSDIPQVRVEVPAGPAVLTLRKGTTNWKIGLGRTGAASNDLTLGEDTDVPVVLKSTAQVGLGTNLPQADLHVAGTMRVDGTLESGCRQVTQSGGDIVEASCGTNEWIKSGGCRIVSGSGMDRINYSAPLPAPAGGMAKTWRCGGFGKNKSVTILCCRQR